MKVQHRKRYTQLQLTKQDLRELRGLLEVIAFDRYHKPITYLCPSRKRQAALFRALCEAVKDATLTYPYGVSAETWLQPEFLPAVKEIA